jgi:hypothetical protein
VERNKQNNKILYKEQKIVFLRGNLEQFIDTVFYNYNIIFFFFLNKLYVLLVNLLKERR